MSWISEAWDRAVETNRSRVAVVEEVEDAVGVDLYHPPWPRRS